MNGPFNKVCPSGNTLIDCEEESPKEEVDEDYNLEEDTFRNNEDNK